MSEKYGVSGILSTRKQSFEDVQLRAKSHLLKENREIIPVEKALERAPAPAPKSRGTLV